MKRSNRRSSQPATKLFDHVRELQMRFLASFAVMVVASIIVYFFYNQILNFLRAPLNSPLYYNTPAGNFAFIMKICFMGSLMITIPYIVYNIVMFVQPAFERRLTRARIYATTTMSSILSISGAAFAYYLVLPGSLRFFGDFKVTNLHALISADSYLNFVTNIIITFIIVFQLPLVIAFIDHVKPLKPKSLLKYEKWIVIGSLIISILMPFAFDLMTTIFVAAPIVILYNISILFVIFQHHQSDRSVCAATIAQPSNQINSFSLDELSSNEMIDELDTIATIQKVAPVQPSRVATEVSHQTTAQQPSIPAWVIEKKMRREALLNAQSKVKVFNDFRRPIRVS